jgi:hypothetical protein
MSLIGVFRPQLLQLICDTGGSMALVSSQIFPVDQGQLQIHDPRLFMKEVDE